MVVSDSGARGRGFDPHSGRRVVSLSKMDLPPKKRKLWLLPEMTEKLFTGTLSKKQYETKKYSVYMKWCKFQENV